MLRSLANNHFLAICLPQREQVRPVNQLRPDWTYTFFISSIGSSLYTRSALTAKTAVSSLVSVHLQISTNWLCACGIVVETSSEAIAYESGRVLCDPHAFLSARVHRSCISEPRSRLSVIYSRTDMSQTRRVGVAQGHTLSKLFMYAVGSMPRSLRFLMQSR